MNDEAITERAPPDRPQEPNAGGHGGDGTAQRTEGGDDTPRSESAAGRTADEAMTERPSPEWPRVLNASGREVEEWRGGNPTQRRKIMAHSEGEGDTREDRRGNPPRGGPPEPEGVP